MKNILLLSHISEAYAPTFPFLKYLKTKNFNVNYVFHPLVGTSIKFSKHGFFSSGVDLLKKEKRYKKTISTTDYPLHLILNLLWSVSTGKKYDIVFGLNNLNAFCGLMLKFFNKAEKVVYYTVDYSTSRFKNKFFNRLYLWLDELCVKHCDYVFSVSPRIQEIRKKQGLPDDRNLLQPNGVHIDEIKEINQEKFDFPVKIVFAGHITKSKGVDIVVKALAKIPEKNKFQFDIYGHGPFIGELKKMISEEKMEKVIRLMGNVSNEEILKVLPQYHVGIAIYTLDDQFNYYCDPVKVKEYIGSRILTVMSDVPHIAKDIERLNIGFVVRNDVDDMAMKLKIMCDSDKIRLMRENFSKVDFELDWFRLFDDNFRKVL